MISSPVGLSPRGVHPPQGLPAEGNTVEGRTPDFRASESKADAIVNIIEHFKETLLTREELHQTKGRRTAYTVRMWRF